MSKDNFASMTTDFFGYSHDDKENDTGMNDLRCKRHSHKYQISSKQVQVSIVISLLSKRFNSSVDLDTK
jgi:hypothetical protein